jgi:hypothetical protein
MERLRLAYQEALRLWTEAGGLKYGSEERPQILSAKKTLDEAAAALTEHRRIHSCQSSN